MTPKFSRSWQLFKASLAITLRNRKLMLFPLLSAFLTGLLAVFFLAPLVLPVVLHPTGYRLNQMEHWVALGDYYLPEAHHEPGAGVASTNTSSNVQPGGLPSRRAGPWASSARAPFRGFSSLVSLYLLAIYFASMVLATFFNVAFYGEIIAALNGRGVSLRRGLGLAWRRMPSILAWSLLAGVVGWIIRTIEERLPIIGRIFTGLLGLAWSIAAVFAIPVIIQEQGMRNPLRILRQSASTLKRTWGEGLIGYLGLSAGSAVIFGCSLIPLLVAGAIALALHSIWMMVVAGAIWVVSLLFLAYVSNVAGHVYRCALYVYAAEGVVPDPYSQDLLDMAWKVKAIPKQ